MQGGGERLDETSKTPKICAHERRREDAEKKTEAQRARSVIANCPADCMTEQQNPKRSCAAIFSFSPRTRLKGTPKIPRMLRPKSERTKT